MVWENRWGVLKEFSLSCHMKIVTSLMLNKFQHLFINFIFYIFLNVCFRYFSGKNNFYYICSSLLLLLQSERNNNITHLEEK